MASSIILQSNEVSALQNTLTQSDSAVIPAVYNTREVYKPSATSWYRCQPVSGTAASNQSVSFQLPKYGILTNCLLNFEHVFTQVFGATVVVAAGDKISVSDYALLKNIDRVEFLSSSRVLYTIYFNSDMACMYADLTNEEKAPLDYSAFRNVFDYTASAGGTGPAATGATATAQYCVPLHFPQFSRIDCCPMLSFQEPSQIRVVFGDMDTANGHNAADSAALSTGSTIVSSVPEISLDLRYSMYSESDTATVISENFGDEPSLNKLITGRRYRENPSQVLSIDGATTSIVDGDARGVITMDLRNIDCIESWNFNVFEYAQAGYLNQRGYTSQLQATPYASIHGYDGLYYPLPITGVRILASGQEICNMTGNQLLYSRLQDNGWAALNDSKFAENIGKVQNGYNEHMNGGPLSNSTSMRELNSVQAEIHFNPNPFGLVSTAGGVPAPPAALAHVVQYQCFCSESTVAIESTASSTGRAIISLAN